MKNKKQKFIETGIKARLKNQGRSNRQVKNNYKILMFTFISFIILMCITVITNALGLW